MYISVLTIVFIVLLSKFYKIYLSDLSSFFLFVFLGFLKYSYKNKVIQNADNASQSLIKKPISQEGI